MNIRWAVAAFAAVSTLSAAPITGLVNTGQGLASGAADPNWFVVAPPDSSDVVVSSVVPGVWIANDGTSQWVWQDNTGQPTNVTRTFRISFTIGAGQDPSTATISGRWATDNVGNDILINGVSTGQTSAGFTAWSLFSITGGFVTGLNTLDFTVTDTGIIAGFRAEFLSSNVNDLPGPGPGPSPVPEPSTIVLTIAGLAGIALRRRMA